MKNISRNRLPALYECHPDEIVLASASPRRRELLAALGLSFAVIPSQAPEDELPGETPARHVERLSIAKAADVAGRAQGGRWFIGSDTIVAVDGRLLGKPRDDEDAAAMLRTLSGRGHEVVSGYAIVDGAAKVRVSAAVTTRVRFRKLTEPEIAGYIASGEPRDKAGAYGIQGLGACLVQAIEGSYTNVVGLPLSEVVTALQELGAIRPRS